MTFFRIFKSGDEVRADNGDNCHFLSKICDVTGDDSFTVFREPGFEARPGARYSLICVTERGLYTFKAIVTKANVSPREIEFRALGEYSKMQRRSNFRVKENLPVRALRVTGDMYGAWIETSTVNISEGGVLLKFNKKCEKDQQLKLVIHLNKFGMDVKLPAIKGQVVRCAATKNLEFGYLIGIKFENLPERARNEIMKFVVLGQRSWLQRLQSKRYQNG